jgi:hypothetical protein
VSGFQQALLLNKAHYISVFITARNLKWIKWRLEVLMAVFAVVIWVVLFFGGVAYKTTQPLQPRRS